MSTEIIDLIGRFLIPVTDTLSSAEAPDLSLTNQGDSLHLTFGAALVEVCGPGQRVHGPQCATSSLVSVPISILRPYRYSHSSLLEDSTLRAREISDKAQT